MPSVPEVGLEVQLQKLVSRSHRQFFPKASEAHKHFHKIRLEIRGFPVLFMQREITKQAALRGHCHALLHWVQTWDQPHFQRTAESFRPCVHKGAGAVHVEQGSCTRLRRFRSLFVDPLGFSHVIRSPCFISQQGQQQLSDTCLYKHGWAE